MAVDTQWANVSLLLPLSSDLLDVKGNTVTVAGGAALSSAHAPSGCTNSLLLDGNNDYLTVSGAGLALGTGDFSIEIPAYKVGDSVSGTANAGILLDFRTAEPSVQILLNIAGSTDPTNPNKVVFYVNGANQIVGTTAISTAFKFVTLARISGVTRLFIDGVQEGSSYTDANNYSATSFNVGGRFAATGGDYRSFNGHIGPIRVTKNGRGYSTTFTPPSLPFPRPMISGTVYDASGATVSKAVVARKRSTLAIVGTALSSAVDGTYRIYVPDFSEHVVAKYDTATYPLVDGDYSAGYAEIRDRVIPWG